MLAYHKPETFMAARGNDTPGNGFIRSMSLAMIEAGEHVLATAKSLLCPLPKAGLRVALVHQATRPRARRMESVGVSARLWTEGEAPPVGLRRETVEYEGEW
jgi:hypothetical protein